MSSKDGPPSQPGSAALWTPTEGRLITPPAVIPDRELNEPYQVSDESLRFFQDNGFVILRKVFGEETTAAIRQVVENLMAQRDQLPPEAQRDVYAKSFTADANLWERDPEMRKLVMSPRLALIAAQLLDATDVGVWHDQALFKYPLSPEQSNRLSKRPSGLEPLSEEQFGPLYQQLLFQEQSTGQKLTGQQMDTFYQYLLSQGSLSESQTNMIFQKLLSGENLDTLTQQPFSDEPEGTGRGTPTHRDWYYWAMENGMALTEWLALNKISREAGLHPISDDRPPDIEDTVAGGGLFFIPGSNREKRANRDDIEISGASDEYYRKQWRTRVAFDYGPGDLSAHHANELHGATSNKGDDVRRAYAVIYYDTRERLAEGMNANQRGMLERLKGHGVEVGDHPMSPHTPQVVTGVVERVREPDAPNPYGEQRFDMSHYNSIISIEEYEEGRDRLLIWLDDAVTCEGEGETPITNTIHAVGIEPNSEAQRTFQHGDRVEFEFDAAPTRTSETYARNIKRIEDKE